MERAESRGHRDPMVHIRLESELIKMVDYLAVDWSTTRSGAAERLIREALDKYDAKQERDSRLVAVH